MTHDTHQAIREALKALPAHPTIGDVRAIVEAFGERATATLPPLDWRPIESAPDSVTVETKIDDERGERNVERLQRQGRQWFLPDLTAYVYYSPTHWREVRP